MTGYYNRLVEAKEKYGDRIVAYDGKEALRYSDLLSAVCGYREVLAERTDINYVGSGRLWIEFRFFRDFVRIGYRDDDPEAPFARVEDSLEKAAGAKIVANLADRISTVPLDGGCYEYDLDFLYDLDFDVKENYLL